MAAKRPRRGRPGPDVLVEGDTGPRQPQGGARVREVFRESGDLASREFGVPQADVPGGKAHVVNPQTVPERPPGVPQRPADYHKYHGVPSDEGLYETPDDEIGKAPRPAPVPEVSQAVPVYIIEEPTSRSKRREAAFDSISVAAGTSVTTGAAEPTRILNRDDARVDVLILNEDSTVDIRVSQDKSQLVNPQAQGAAGGGGGGSLIWHGTNSYTKFATQGELWAVTTTSSKALLSVIIVTEVND